jgi:hypothetical protein
MRRVPASVLAGVCLLLTACSGSSSAPPAPSPTPAALDSLAALARTGAAASYTADYALHASNGKRLGTVTVARTPTALRLDFRFGTGSTHTRASLWHDQTGTYTCTPRAGHRKPLCLLLARPGQPAQGVFADYVGLERLFADDLTTLTNASGTSITVSPAPARAATTAVPAAQCFQVTPSTAGTLDRGTYCLSSTGVPVRTVFGSGSSVAMLALHATAPQPSVLAPPRHPIPLPRPKGKPTPSPTPS